MTSQLASRGILYLFYKFAEVIGEGKPFAVLLGFVLGLAAGATVFIESILAGFFAAILGGFIGALIGAILAPRAQVLLSAYAPGGDSGFGAVVDSLTANLGMGGHVTVVMERAIYVVSRSQVQGTTLPQSAYDKLEQGIHPQLESGNLIVLANIVHLEAPVNTSAGFHMLIIHYLSKGRPRSKRMEFASDAARTDYLKYLEQHMRTSFESETVPMELRRALMAPIITLIVTCLATIGLTLLSAHWRNSPPAPPVDKPKGDELVRALTFLGPLGVLAIGGAVVLVLLFWMYLRMKSPPLLVLYRPVRATGDHLAQ